MYTIYTFTYSFESYELRRFNNLNTKLPSHSQKQQHDKTDSISIINPYITEINLWPSNLIKTFLREIKIIKSLIDLENAMCDIRYNIYIYNINIITLISTSL